MDPEVFQPGLWEQAPFPALPAATSTVPFFPSVWLLYSLSLLTCVCLEYSAEHSKRTLRRACCRNPSGLLSALLLCPGNSGCLSLSRLNSGCIPFSTWFPTPAPQPRNSLKLVTWAIRRFALVLSLVDITVSHCLVSSGLKTVVSNILFVF